MLFRGGAAEEDPAVELKADSGVRPLSSLFLRQVTSADVRHGWQNKAIKLAHELNEVDESSTGESTSKVLRSRSFASLLARSLTHLFSMQDKKGEDDAAPTEDGEKSAKQKQSEGGKKGAAKVLLFRSPRLLSHLTERSVLL